MTGSPSTCQCPHDPPEALTDCGALALAHLLTLSGVFQKFVSWIDRCHRRSPSMDGFRMAWELPDSPTCLPNGPASARCLASLCCNLTRPVEWSRQRHTLTAGACHSCPSSAASISSFLF